MVEIEGRRYYFVISIAKRIINRGIDGREDSSITLILLGCIYHLLISCTHELSTPINSNVLIKDRMGWIVILGHEQ